MAGRSGGIIGILASEADQQLTPDPIDTQYIWGKTRPCASNRVMR